MVDRLAKIVQTARRKPVEQIRIKVRSIKHGHIFAWPNYMGIKRSEVPLLK